MKQSGQASLEYIIVIAMAVSAVTYGFAPAYFELAKQLYKKPTEMVRKVNERT